MSESKERYLNLEGLRGLAALVVVFYHYIVAFTPFVNQKIYVGYQTWYSFLLATPLKLSLAGDFSVCIFFVLSGFVLSISYFKHRTIDRIVSAAARRYFRLMIPAFVSIMLAYIILRTGLMFAHTTGQLSHQTGLLSTFWTFSPHVFSAIYQGLFGVFFTGFRTYNPVLWTMQIELCGSFLIFMFLALFGKLSRRWIFYGVIALVTVKTYYLGMVFGMTLCDIWINYPSIKKRLSNRLLIALLPIGMLLGAWDNFSFFFRSIHIPMYSTVDLQVLAHTIGALIIVTAVLKLSLLKQFFESKPLQFLGRVSFSLYLTHFILMGSLACLIFNIVLPHLGYTWTVITTFSISIPISLWFASIYTTYVDIRSIAWSKTIGTWLTSEPKLAPKATELAPIPIGITLPEVTLQPAEQEI